MRFSMTCLAFVLLFASVCGEATGTWGTGPTMIRQETNGSWHVERNDVGGWGFLFFLQGEKKARYELRLWDALPEADFERLPKTTAGRFWAECSVHYFVDLQGETHFCVRTWWDRRILVNLVRLKQVSDRPFAETLDQEERTIVLKTLQEAVPKYVGTEKDDDARDTYAVIMDMWAVRSAAYMAGRLKIREAIKFLKPLESVASVGTIADFWHSRKDASKDIDLTYYTNPLRRVIQVSLRQLGETPHNYPATKLEFSIEHFTGFFSYERTQDYASRHELASQLKDNEAFTYQAKEYKKSRHERAPQLSQGMRAVAVLDAMGPPDVVDDYDDEWRWDVCAQKPYSVVVKWDQQSRTVTSVRRIDPLWLRKELILEERRWYR